MILATIIYKFLNGKLFWFVSVSLRFPTVDFVYTAWGFSENFLVLTLARAQHKNLKIIPRRRFPAWEGAGTLPPGRQVLQGIGKGQKVSDPEQIIEDVVQSMAKWQALFRQYEVPEKDIQRLAPGITQRLNRIEDPLIK